MPLTMASAGQEMQIKKIGGKDETRRFLENLGFVRIRLWSEEETRSGDIKRDKMR